MTWTYSLTGATLSTKDQVRLLIGDTNSGRPLVADQEITWALSVHGSVYFCGALLCDSLGAAKGNVASKRVGDLALTYDPSFFRGLAAQLRRQGAVQGSTPFAGGISVADKDTRANDTDRTQPFFTRDMQRVAPASYPSPTPPGNT